MLLFFLFCVGSIHLVVGNGALLPADHAAIKPADNDIEVKTKKILSEGGVIDSDTLAKTLPKENRTILMSLDKELGMVNKDKSGKSRKRVLNNTLEYLQSSQSSLEVKQSSEALNISEGTSKTSSTTVSKPILNKSNVVTKLKKTTAEPKFTPKVNKTEVPKKPLILSYDALAMKNLSFSTILKSSSKTSVADQLQSPNDDTVKIYSINANRHPGMVMPVVITILVVPMFAVLGYMALKRGQEAWKNRHYKRMDFLLDGMYND